MGNFEQLAAFEASLTPDQPWPELAEECMPLFPTRLLPDGLGQLGQGFLVKVFSGLVQARLHLGDGEGHRAALLGVQGAVTQQRIQPSS